MEKYFLQLKDSLNAKDIEFEWSYSDKLHDRFIIADNGWTIQMGRELHYFQSLEGEYFQIGANDMDLRPCLLTSFDFYRS